jgi:hypothetical protein
MSATKPARIRVAVKYWEIIADKLSAAGWSWGYCSAVTRDGWRWIVDAHREGRRYIVRSDELLSAVLGAGSKTSGPDAGNSANLKF